VVSAATHQLQATLFHSIKPLFANKPVLIVANKTDVVQLEQLSGASSLGGWLCCLQKHASSCAIQPRVVVSIHSLSWNIQQLSPPMMSCRPICSRGPGTG